MARVDDGTACLLFVYGSLKRGQANHRELRGARFVAESRTVAAFALSEVSGYPALVPGGRAISGELYELDRALLGDLDEFEGEAYERREIRLEDDQIVIAYVARAPTLGVPLAFDSWPPPQAAR